MSDLGRLVAAQARVEAEHQGSVGGDAGSASPLSGEPGTDEALSDLAQLEWVNAGRAEQLVRDGGQPVLVVAGKVQARVDVLECRVLPFGHRPRAGYRCREGRVPLEPAGAPAEARQQSGGSVVEALLERVQVRFQPLNVRHGGLAHDVEHQQSVKEGRQRAPLLVVEERVLPRVLGRRQHVHAATGSASRASAANALRQSRLGLPGSL